MLQDTVYVVDDQPAVLRLIDHILTREGYNVRTFQTAGEARSASASALARNERLAVVLLDLYLGPQGEMSSRDLLQYLRSEHPESETVVMSARLSSNDLYALVFLGAANIMHKPFSPDELLRLVRQHMDIGRQRYEFSDDPWSCIRRLHRDAFLSYAPADAGWALGLKRLLESAGISVWYADSDLLDADTDQGRVLRDALGSCEASLAVVSPAALASEVFVRLLRKGGERKRREGTDCLLLALLRSATPADLPGDLRNIECWDFSRHDDLVDRIVSLTSVIRLFRGRSLG